MARQTFTDTSGKLARDSGVTVQCVTLYARLGFLTFITSSNGTRLYAQGQAGKVRKIYERRMAHRGRKKGAARQQ